MSKLHNPNLAVALAIAGLAAGCSRPTETRSEAARPVKTMVVTDGDEPLVRTFPGRVEASRSVDLAFQVPGLLVNLPVKEGQKVAKGAVIAQPRQDEFQERVKSLQGQVDQARASLSALQVGERPEERLSREAQLRAVGAKVANAKTEFDRYSRLVQSSAVSRAEYELAATAYRVAQEEQTAARQLVEKGTGARTEDIDAQAAEVRTLEARLAEASLQLADSTLRAPYSGVVAQRFVDEKQSIVANKPVVTLQNVDEIDIVADVPEAAMAADIRSTAFTKLVAEFSTAPGVQFPVRIKEVAQVADPATQTFKVRVAMPAPRRVNVLPGMTATVAATYRRAGARGRRILVPISAVFKEDTGEQVAWIIGPDQLIGRRLVKMGAATGGQVEILDGLRPGDRIVVAGAPFLSPGMRVRDLGDALGGD
uniref:Efflux transporter, RND family, MFP subunit n=1 Tax=Solibacter usitatus (strain Ellin6076) TaxID=234267 RepID=Q01UC4_SOLUE